MGRLGALVVGVLLGAGLVIGALNYHVVRTNAGYEMIPKGSMSFESIYVDTRQFGAADWIEHEALVRAIVKADKQHLLKEAAVDSLVGGVQSALDKLR